MSNSRCNTKLQTPNNTLTSTKYPTLLIFGPPGSGKGTVGRYLCNLANLCHLSSGDIFRGLSPDSPAGRLFHQYASQGLLVPDDVTIEIFNQYVCGLIATNRFFPSQQYLLLDGIPRTLPQAQVLSEYIDVKNIIFLDMPNREKLISRLQRRGKIEGRKDDMDVKVLEKRLEVFDKDTSDVLSHYPKNIISKINADQKPLEVMRDILIKIADILVAMPSADKPA